MGGGEGEQWGVKKQRKDEEAQWSFLQLPFQWPPRPSSPITTLLLKRAASCSKLAHFLASPSPTRSPRHYTPCNSIWWTLCKTCSLAFEPHLSLAVAAPYGPGLLLLLQPPLHPHLETHSCPPGHNLVDTLLPTGQSTPWPEVPVLSVIRIA